MALRHRIAIVAALLAAAAAVGVSSAAAEAGYCFNGRYAALPLGTPASDPQWAGATPAHYELNVGLTCDPLPPGWVYTGATVNAIMQNLSGAGDPATIYPLAAPLWATALSAPTTSFFVVPQRIAYCSKGKYVELYPGQPATDPTYAGAVPAYYYKGIGLTCDNTPNGWVFNGELVNRSGVDQGPSDPEHVYRYAAPELATYCGKQGNSLQLLLGQPTWDPVFRNMGLVPAFYYQGTGLSCSASPPAGVVMTGGLVNRWGVDLGASDPGRIYKYGRKA